MRGAGCGKDEGRGHPLQFERALTDATVSMVFED